MQHLVLDFALIILFEPVLNHVFGIYSKATSIIIFGLTVINFMVDLYALPAMVDRKPIACVFFNMFFYIKRTAAAVLECIALFTLDQSDKASVMGLLVAILVTFSQIPLLHCMAAFCEDVSSDFFNVDASQNLSWISYNIWKLGRHYLTLPSQGTQHEDECDICEKCQLRQAIYPQEKARRISNLD